MAAVNVYQSTTWAIGAGTRWLCFPDCGTFGHVQSTRPDVSIEEHDHVVVVSAGRVHSSWTRAEVGRAERPPNSPKNWAAACWTAIDHVG
jgi:hypothetical protein